MSHNDESSATPQGVTKSAHREIQKMISELDVVAQYSHAPEQRERATHRSKSLREVLASAHKPVQQNGRIIRNTAELQELPTPTLLSPYYSQGESYVTLLQDDDGTRFFQGVDMRIELHSHHVNSLFPLTVVSSPGLPPRTVEAIEFTGHNREEVLEQLHDWDGAPYWANAKYFGTDNGWKQDRDGHFYGEPAVKPGDWLLRRPDGTVLAYRPVLQTNELATPEPVRAKDAPLDVCGAINEDYPDEYYCTYPVGHDLVSDEEADIHNMDHGAPLKGAWWGTH